MGGVNDCEESFSNKKKKNKSYISLLCIQIYAHTSAHKCKSYVDDDCISNA